MFLVRLLFMYVAVWSFSTPGVVSAPPGQIFVSVETGSSATSLSLLYAPPDDNGLTITDYEISTKIGDLGYSPPISIGLQSNGYTLVGLNATAVYSFKVRALNGHGNGLWSPPTDPVRPSAPRTPGGFTVGTGSNFTVISFAWQDVPALAGDVVSQYVVQRRVDGSLAFTDWMTVPAVPGNDVEFDIELGDEAEINYDYRVAAEAPVGGRGPYTQASGLVAAGSFAPPIARIDSWSPTQVHVTFSPSAVPQEISGVPFRYEIQTSHDGSFWTTPLEADQPGPGAKEHTISVSGTGTAVHVRARSVRQISQAKFLFGAWGVPDGPAVLGSPPSPGNVNALTQADGTSLLVTWSDPRPVHAPYTMEVQQSTDSGATWVSIITGIAEGVEQYLVSGLAMTQKYRYRLFAHSTTTYGSSRATQSTFDTFAGSPRRPEAVQVFNGPDYRSFHLKWTATTAPASNPVLSYTLYYEELLNPGTLQKYEPKTEEIIGPFEVTACCFFDGQGLELYKNLNPNNITWFVVATNSIGASAPSLPSVPRTSFIPMVTTMRFEPVTDGRVMIQLEQTSCVGTIFEVPLIPISIFGGNTGGHTPQTLAAILERLHWARCAWVGVASATTAESWQVLFSPFFYEIEYQKDGDTTWTPIPPRYVPHRRLWAMPRPWGNSASAGYIYGTLDDSDHQQCECDNCGGIGEPYDHCQHKYFPTSIGRTYTFRYRLNSYIYGASDWRTSTVTGGAPKSLTQIAANQSPLYTNLGAIYIANSFVLGIRLNTPLCCESTNGHYPEKISLELKCLDVSTLLPQPLPTNANYTADLGDGWAEWPSEPQLALGISSIQTIFLPSVGSECFWLARIRPWSSKFGYGAPSYISNRFDYLLKTRYIPVPNKPWTEPAPAQYGPTAVTVVWNPPVMPHWATDALKQAMASTDTSKFRWTIHIRAPSSPAFGWSSELDMAGPVTRRADGTFSVVIVDSDIASYLEYYYSIGAMMEPATAAIAGVPAFSPPGLESERTYQIGELAAPFISVDDHDGGSLNITVLWKHINFNPASAHVELEMKSHLNGQEWSPITVTPQLDWSSRDISHDLEDSIARWSVTVPHALSPGDSVSIRGRLSNTRPGYWSKVSVTVIASPSVPVLTSFISGDDTSELHVSWEASVAQGAAAVSHYIVRLVPQDPIFAAREYSVSAPVTSLDIASAGVNDTAYTVQISAVDTLARQSDYTLNLFDPLWFNSPATMPPPSVTEATTEIGGSTALQNLVSWSVPKWPNGDLVTDVTTYQVQYRLSDIDGNTHSHEHMGWKGLYTTSAHMSYTHSPLLPAICYQYRIRAMVDAHVGQWSDVQPGCHYVNIPHPVANVLITEDGPSSINITYAPTLDERIPPFDHYTYEVSQSIDGGSSWSLISPAKFSDTHLPVTVSGGLEYIFKIRAVDRARVYGDWVSSMPYKTGMPSAPDGVQLYATLSGVSVNVTWGASVPKGGDSIVAYAVEFQKKGETHWHRNVSNTDATSYIVTGLDPEVEYRFRIGAKSLNSAWGPWSEISSWTKSALSLPPYGITWYRIKISVILLQWEQEYVTSTAPLWEIEKSVDGRPWTNEASVNTPSFTDDRAFHGEVLRYRIRLVTADGGASPWTYIDNVQSGTGEMTPVSPPVLNVALSPTDPSALIVSWSHHTDYQKVDSFEIQQRMDKEGYQTFVPAVQAIVAANVSAPETTLVMSGLTYGQNYQFRVRALNKAQYGALSSCWSSPSTSMSNSMPVKLTVRASPGHNSKSLGVYLHFNASRPIEAFIVQYKQLSDSIWASRIVGPGDLDARGQLNIPVPNFGVGHVAHSLRVAAISGAAPTATFSTSYTPPVTSFRGPWTLLPTVYPRAPPDAPELNYVVLAAGIVRAQWRVDNSINSYTSYYDGTGAPLLLVNHMEYKNLNEPDAGWTSVPQPISQPYDVKKLDPDDTYIFRFRVSDGSTLYSPWVESEPITPSRPSVSYVLLEQRNTTTSLGQDTLSVIWHPVKLVPELTGYRVRYRLSRWAESWTYVDVAATVNQHDLAIVQPGQSYDIGVAAVYHNSPVSPYCTMTYTPGRVRSQDVVVPHVDTSGTATLVHVYTLIDGTTPPNDQYYMTMMETEGGEWPTLTDWQQLWLTDFAVQPIKRYRFRQRRFDDATGLISEWSQPTAWMHAAAPRPPLVFNPTRSAIGQPPKRAIVLTWTDQVGMGSLPPTGGYSYIVQMLDTSTGIWIDLPTPVGGLLQKKIVVTENLKPRTMYGFRVAAVEPTKWGRGGWSHVSATTDLGSPQAPNSVSVESSGSGFGHARISWGHPDDVYGDGDPVARYHIEWRRSDHTAWVAGLTVPGNETSVVVAAPIDDYSCSSKQLDVRVSAESAKYGQGDFAELYTRDFINVPAVRVVTVRSGGVDELLVQWSLDEPYNWPEPSSYTVYMKVGAGSYTYYGESKAKSIHVTGLSNPGPYLFRVTVNVRESDLNPSCSSTISSQPVESGIPVFTGSFTAPPAPPEPPFIVGTGNAADQLVVQVTTPAHLGSDLTAIELIITNSQGYSQTVDVPLSAEGTPFVHVFNGLTPGVEYKFVARAENKNGWSSLSQASYADPVMPVSVPSPLRVGSADNDFGVAIVWEGIVDAPGVEQIAMIQVVHCRVSPPTFCSESDWENTQAVLNVSWPLSTTASAIPIFDDSAPYIVKARTLGKNGTYSAWARSAEVHQYMPYDCTDVQASVTGPNTVALSWTHNDNPGNAVPATSEYIVESSVDGINWQQTSQQPVGVTKTVNIVQGPGAPVAYRVTAVNSIGKGGWSTATPFVSLDAPNTVLETQVVVDPGTVATSIIIHEPKDVNLVENDPIDHYEVMMREVKLTPCDVTEGYVLCNRPTSFGGIFPPGFSGEQQIGAGEFLAPLGPVTMAEINCLGGAPMFLDPSPYLAFVSALFDATGVTQVFTAPCSGPFVNLFCYQNCNPPPPFVPSEFAIVGTVAPGGTLVLDNLVPDSKYEIKMRAVSLVNGPGPWPSNPYVVIPGTFSPPYDLAVAPGWSNPNFVAQVTWQEGTGPSSAPLLGYELEYSTDNGGSWADTPVQPVGATPGASIVLAVGLGWEVLFRARGVNAHGKTEWAQSTKPVIPGQPLAPTDVTASPRIDITELQVTWTSLGVFIPTDSLTGFEVEITDDDGTTWAAIPVQPFGVVTSHVIGGLNPTSFYSFRVRSISQNYGPSEYSLASDPIKAGGPLSISKTRPTAPSPMYAGGDVQWTITISPDDPNDVKSGLELEFDDGSHIMTSVTPSIKLAGASIFTPCSKTGSVWKCSGIVSGPGETTVVVKYKVTAQYDGVLSELFQLNASPFFPLAESSNVQVLSPLSFGSVTVDAPVHLAGENVKYLVTVKNQIGVGDITGMSLDFASTGVDPEVLPRWKVQGSATDAPCTVSDDNLVTCGTFTAQGDVSGTTETSTVIEVSFIIIRGQVNWYLQKEFILSTAVPLSKDAPDVFIKGGIIIAPAFTMPDYHPCHSSPLVVTFTTTNQVGAADWIYLTLPVGSMINQGGSTTATSADIGGGFSVQLGNATTAGVQVMLHRDGSGLPMTVLHYVSDLKLSHVIVSGATTAGNNLVVATVQDSDRATIDGPTMSTIPFTPPRGSLTDVAVRVNQEVAGAVGILSVDFKLGSALGALDTIHLALPSTFKLNEGFPTDVVGASGITGILSVQAGSTPDDITITRTGGQLMAKGSSISVTLSNVRFPRVQGVAAATTFTVWTKCTGGGTVDGPDSPATGVEFKADPVIAPQVKLFVGHQIGLSVLRVIFTTPLQLFATDKIKLTLPPQFDLPNMPSSIAVNYTGVTGTLQLSNPLSTQLTLSRLGDGGVVASGTEITLYLDSVPTPLPGTTDDFLLELLTPSNDAITSGVVQGVSVHAGIVFSTNSFTLVEGDPSTHAVEVVLDYPLEGTQVLAFDMQYDPSEVSANVQSLQFTKDNWNVPQTILFSAIDNELSTGDHALTVQALKTRGPSYFTFVYQGTSRPGKFDVTITLKDNDIEPAISSFAPLEGALMGGTYVAIQGIRLGFKAAEVKDVIVGGQSCKNSSVWIDPNEIRCVTQAAASLSSESEGIVQVVLHPNKALGRNTEVTIAAGKNFQYRMPRIIQVSPSTGPVAGNTRVTVQGQYFGSSQSSIAALTVAGVPCTDTIWFISSTIFGCVTKPGSQGSSGPIVVTSGKLSITSTEQFLYADSKREILGVEPPSGGSLGGDLVRILGSRFVEQTSEIGSVTLAGRPCLNPIALSIREIVCRTSESDQRKGNIVVVLREGGSNITLDSGSTVQFSYVYPMPEVTRLRPTVVTPNGGTRVTIRGSYFGRTADVDSLSVTIGDRNCTRIEWVSESEISCIAPIHEVGTPMHGKKVGVTYLGKHSDMGPTTPTISYGEECFPPTHCGWDAQCLPSTLCLCDLGWSGPPACETPAFLLTIPAVNLTTPRNDTVNYARALTLPTTLRGKNYTNEDGELLTLHLHLFLQPSPEVPVIFSCSSDKRNEAVVTNSPIVVDPDNWKIPYPVEVRGVIDDARDGSQTVNITCRAIGGGSKFENAPATTPLTVINLDSSPDIFNVNPKIIPLSGTTITVTARNLDDGFTMYVDNSTIPYTVLKRLLQAPPSTSTSGNQTGNNTTLAPGPPDGGNRPYLRYTADIGTLSEGYHSFSIVNAGGTKTLVQDLFYISDACPDPGFIGQRENCIPCPSGATCPGGGRIIPASGFWNGGEDSGFVGQCFPESRCLGMVNGTVQCAEPYTGDFCALCKPGHVMIAQMCEECPDPSLIAAYILLAFGIWTALGLMNGMVAESSANTYVLHVVITLQMTAAIGGMRAEAVPSGVHLFYGLIPAFNADYRVLRTECIAAIPWATSTGIRLGYLFAILVWFLLMNWVAIFMKRKKLVTAAEEEQEEIFKRKEENEDHTGITVKGGLMDMIDNDERTFEVVQEELVESLRELSVFAHQRYIRCFFLWATLMYFAASNIALELVACTKIAGKWVSLNYQGETCYTRTHIALVALAYLLLLVVTLGFPAAIATFIWKKRSETTDSAFLQKYGLWYELYRPGMLFFGLIDFALLFTLAAGNALLSRTPEGQLIAFCVVSVFKMTLLLWQRPHMRGLDNLVQAVALLLLLIAVNYNFLIANTYLEGGSIAATALILVAFTGLAICVIYLSVYALMIVLVRAPMENKYKQLLTVKEKNDQVADAAADTPPSLDYEPLDRYTDEDVDAWSGQSLQRRHEDKHSLDNSVDYRYDSRSDEDPIFMVASSLSPRDRARAGPSGPAGRRRVLPVQDASTRDDDASMTYSYTQ